jgi:formylglycine-generating enzyme required for sulfatase activity
MTTLASFSTKASIGLTKRVPGGYPRLGSRFHPREAPPRVLRIDEFEIAHTPVTVAQYAAFVNREAVHDPRWWSKEGWSWRNGELDGWGRENRRQPDAWEMQVQRPYHPVVGVTLHEAIAYCNWVSSEKKRKVRLPSEEEWEYAARGEDGRPFPWGEEFDPTFANLFESELHHTSEVASIPGDISPFEVMDMCGNAQEWTSSAYTPLAGEVYPPGMLFVARGGSFNDTAFGGRASYRRAYPPGYFFPFLGFRVVVEAIT